MKRKMKDKRLNRGIYNWGERSLKKCCFIKDNVKIKSYRSSRKLFQNQDFFRQ